MLGEIVKRASGMPVDRFAVEHLFGPLDISDFYWDRFENGVIAADGGLFMRPRDMAKIGLLVLNTGSDKGLQIVSKSWIEESTRIHIDGGGVGYGYQWRRTLVAAGGQKSDVIYASGLGGQLILIVPKLDAVVVITSKTHHHYGGELQAERLFVESILPALMNIEPADRKIVSIPVDSMRSFVGHYASTAAGRTGSVFLEDEKLYLQIPGKGTAELHFTGPGKCFGRMDGLDEFVIHAVENENGLVGHARFSVGLKSFRLDRVK